MDLLARMRGKAKHIMVSGALVGTVIVPMAASATPALAASYTCTYSYNGTPYTITTNSPAKAAALTSLGARCAAS